MDTQSSVGDDPRLQPLVEYLEQHQRQINLAALRKQLLEAGHPADLVAEAVRRVEAGSPRRPLAWPLGLLVMLANIVVLPPLFAGLAGLTTSISPTSNDSLVWLIPPLLVAALLLGGEFVVGLRLRGGPRDRLGRTLIWGAAFTMIAFALLALLFGICLAILVGSLGQ
ncbi:MAG: hypothetical protein HGA45_25670 [Chloroflexales bacterium]|nr:hypothetical protein [Chloroflexales bacterium]